MKPWEVVFMDMAKALSQRSKDTSQVGCIIVDPETHEILGQGFNGPPFCFKDEEVPLTRPEKYDYFIHAEMNALFFCKRRPMNAHLYVTGVPCSKCMLAIAQNGVSCVYYGDRTPHMCDMKEQLLVSKLAAMGAIELKQVFLD